MPRDFQFSSPAASFVLKNAVDLASAAKMLGGARAQSRTADLVERIRYGEKSGRGLRRDLNRLRDLLGLKNVDDIDSDEADFFSRIDPSSPEVERICILHDNFVAAISSDPFLDL